MRRWILVGAVVAVVTACASDDMAGRSTPVTSVPVSTTAAVPATAPSNDGCPVVDDAFCTTAAAAADALRGGDAERLIALSRADTLDCADVAREYFPGCVTVDEVLEGHGISDADFTVDVVDAAAHEEFVRTVVDDVDPSFVDELGDGSAPVIGVGTCGPDESDRRTYHLAWTAALAGAGGAPRRVLGSFEFGFRDDEWRILLTYVDTLERWEAAQPDPLREAFCAAGRSPWS